MSRSMFVDLWLRNASALRRPADKRQLADYLAIKDIKADLRRPGWAEEIVSPLDGIPTQETIR